jgi:hypothetical protein
LKSEQNPIDFEADMDLNKDKFGKNRSVKKKGGKRKTMMKIDTPINALDQDNVLEAATPDL